MQTIATADNHFVERHWPKMAVASVLTFASGLVDIVGYLGVFHLFTAHLTGTTVQLGHSLAARQTWQVWAAASIVGAFLAGSISGRALIEMGSRNRIRRIASATLAVESILLALVILVGPESSHGPYVGLALLAAAMGIQTGTLTGIGPLTVHPTFVTGMLNKVAQLSAHILFRTYGFAKARRLADAARKHYRHDIQMILFLTAIWLCYVAGAAFGTWCFDAWRLRALLVAIACLAISITVDGLSPLSVQEEREQSEQ
jgi:uncharacterized membrane protein YoaK (UPF0700 family)